MPTARIFDVATEVEQVGPCFGLPISGLHAAVLAALYVHQRPYKPAESVVAALLRMPLIPWLEDDTLSIRLTVMRTLVAHLDGLYFVATFEHDGLAGARASL